MHDNVRLRAFASGGRQVTGVPALWLDDGDVRLFHGDCLDVLRELPDRSVHMCATSPPFYGLRDYGVQGQIGLEETPDMWVARLVAVFREVRRVLRDDGTLWVEIGDSYVSGQGGRQSAVGEMPARALSLDSSADVGRGDVDTGSWRSGATSKITPARGTTDLKPKDLLGQPWMLAFALRADGWYLRSEIIWARPNPMPESVTDRPTKAHSTVFLLSKSARYFYDADAIREPHQPDGRKVTTRTVGESSHGNYDTFGHEEGRERWPNPAGANARTVWTIPTEPTPFAHFATWPQKLVARMIRAGTSEKGCCPECGAPWVRETAAEHDAEGRTTNGRKPRTERRRGFDVRMVKSTTTLEWRETCWHGDLICSSCDGRRGSDLHAEFCECGGRFEYRPHDPVPCVVLDPFAGSGTTLKVARDHGRHSVGIELSEDYCRIAADRLAQQSLLTGDVA